MAIFAWTTTPIGQGMDAILVLTDWTFGARRLGIHCRLSFFTCFAKGAVNGTVLLVLPTGTRGTWLYCIHVLVPHWAKQTLGWTGGTDFGSHFSHWWETKTKKGCENTKQHPAWCLNWNNGNKPIPVAQALPSHAMHSVTPLWYVPAGHVLALYWQV